MPQQVNPFVQQAMQLHQQIYPLLQQGLQHRQMMMGEFAKIATISQNLVPSCDALIQAINSGNTQQALATANNLRGMSGQLLQSAQLLSSGIAQRMDTMFYMLQIAQQRINWLLSLMQGVRPQVGFFGAPYQYGMPYQQSAYLS
jgi:hypothetical protein